MSAVRRVAIVTGAARGIGRAIALRLAADGIDIAANDLPGSKLQDVVSDIEKTGRQACALYADVGNEAEVKSMIDTTVSKLGGLDIVSLALDRDLHISHTSCRWSQTRV
jgi:NAD(P)-dependent dehydrogenase (short-subunit alcohol dehydrogenase family)